MEQCLRLQSVVGPFIAYSSSRKFSQLAIDESNCSCVAFSAVDHDRNEVQLLNDGLGHLKGIKIGLAQTASQPI